MATFREIADIVNYGTQQQKEEFSVACASYNKLRRSVDRIMVQLSRECGWKGPGSLDFKGFHRFHIEHGEDGIHFMNGKQDLCCFSIDANGKACIEGEWFPYGATTDEAISEAFSNCLSEDNLTHAHAYTYGGCRPIRGMAFSGDRYVFDRSSWFDESVEALLSRKYPGCSFVNGQHFSEMHSSCFIPHKGVHEEPLRPVCFMEFYNGNSLSNKGEHPAGDSRMRGVFHTLKDTFDFLMETASFCVGIRQEMERSAGIEEGTYSMPLSFDTAVYPVPGSRMNTFDLVTDGGTQVVGSFQFRGKEAVYVCKDLYAPPVHLKGSAAIQKFLAETCLCEENILRAKNDIGFSEEQGESQGETVKKSNQRKI